MKPAFAAGLCVSDLVAVAQEGEQLGEVIVPEGKIGLATVCSIVINGTLLKAGVPIDSRFGGILQITKPSATSLCGAYSLCWLLPRPFRGIHQSQDDLGQGGSQQRQRENTG